MCIIESISFNLSFWKTSQVSACEIQFRENKRRNKTREEATTVFKVVLVQVVTVERESN